MHGYPHIGVERGQRRAASITILYSYAGCNALRLESDRDFQPGGRMVCQRDLAAMQADNGRHQT